MASDSVKHERLRVLHVSEVTWGGVVTLLRHFVKEQAETGHIVRVLAPSSLPEMSAGERRNWHLDRARPATFGRALRELRRNVRSFDPDVIHAHSFVAGLLCRLPGVLPRSRRAVLVYQPHAWSVDLFSSRLVAKAVAGSERWCSKRTDVLVTNCRDEVDAGRRLGVYTPAHVLGVAVDLRSIQPPTEQERREARQALDIPTGCSVVLLLGRIARQKGQDLLVGEWERERPSGASLFLVGPGDTAGLRPLSPTQWGKTVHAVGEPPDIRPWLAASDVMVLPSRYETVGLVVAEALAAGLPVVATDVHGVREAVASGDLPSAGAVVAIGDMVGLMREVADRLLNDDLRTAEGLAARQRAEASFDPGTVAEKLENAYRSATRVAVAKGTR